MFTQLRSHISLRSNASFACSNTSGLHCCAPPGLNLHRPPFATHASALHVPADLIIHISTDDLLGSFFTTPPPPPHTHIARPFPCPSPGPCHSTPVSAFSFLHLHRNKASPHSCSSTAVILLDSPKVDASGRQVARCLRSCNVHRTRSIYRGHICLGRIRYCTQWWRRGLRQQEN